MKYTGNKRNSMDVSIVSNRYVDLIESEVVRLVVQMNTVQEM